MWVLEIEERRTLTDLESSLLDNVEGQGPGCQRQLEPVFLCLEPELIYQYVSGSSSMTCLALRIKKELIPVPSRSRYIFLLLWYHIPDSGWGSEQGFAPTPGPYSGRNSPEKVSGRA